MTDSRWTGAPPELDHLVPPIGAVSAEERMLRANWLSHLLRSPAGYPLLPPDFVGPLGRGVRIVDVREESELLGPYGYIPGADWVPLDRVASLRERLAPDAKVVLVSRAGERAGPLAHALERAGLPFSASMLGGMVAWHLLGFHTTRDPAILSRRDVLTEVPVAPPAPGKLTREAVEAHLGDVSALRWVKMAALLLHGRTSCVDGRDETGVVGTPGGAAGELALGLAAIESLGGKRLGADELDVLVERHMRALGRFYLHTDIHAANQLITDLRADARFDDAIRDVREAMQWRRFFASPPDYLEEPLLEYVAKPANIGCGHLRLSIQNGDAYGVRPELVVELMRAFYRARFCGAPDADLVVLPGGHPEGAVLDVRVEGGVSAWTPVPLVPARCAGTQTFVSHPEVVAVLRRELVSFLVSAADLTGVGPSRQSALAGVVDELGARQMGATLSRLAAGLPIFRATFAPDGSRVRVEEAGSVA